MVKRKLYLNKIYKLMDKEEVKIITGVRRSGKTYLLKQVIEELKEKGIPDENIIYISFESSKYRKIKNDEELDEIVFNLTKNIKGKIYLFFDEIQRVKNWEESINSYRIDLDSDIYVTGSYSNLLNGINRTLLSGRYIRIHIYPFSYKELLEYYREEKGSLLTYNEELNIFNNYLSFGGFPGLLKYDDNDEKLDYLSDIYDSIMLKDILDIEKIGTTELFERLMEFMVSNIGQLFSATSISKYLKSEKRSISTSTVLNYIKYATNALLLYQTKREDLVGKKILNVSEKYYVVDPGFYYLFNDVSKRNLGSLLENIIYLEFKRRNYDVTIGKIYDLEVDFICKKPGKKMFVQVSNSILDEKTMEREFKSLRKIKESYPKYILTMDTVDLSRDGIIHMNIMEFLKDGEI